MASRDPHFGRSLYPQVDDSAPTSIPSPSATPSPSMYPTIDLQDLAENLFPNADVEDDHSHKATGDKEGSNRSSLLEEPPVEETLVRIPGAILHLIDRHQSVEIGCGDFVLARLRQGENVIAVLARVGDAVQWPLAKDEAAVRLDDSHYFFSLNVPEKGGRGGGNLSPEDLLNYGLTFASKGQEGVLKELDRLLEKYSSFSVQKVVAEKGVGGEVLDGKAAKGTTPEEVMVKGSKKEALEKEASAYWTTLAPNVEDYSGSIARLIAKGSGQLIRGILWGGNVTVDRLKWGNAVLKKRIAQKEKPSDINPATLKRIQRVKTVTKMSEKVASGILSGVVKVSGFFTSSVVNSKLGKKFCSLLPGEIALATLDGFSKICDAVEVAGKNVLSTSSTVTTGLVSHRYGEQAANATSHSMDAAGHAIGTAWAVFKIRKALNPKSVLKPTTLAKSVTKAAAADQKGKK